jgi:hypothetical protein
MTVMNYSHHANLHKVNDVVSFVLDIPTVGVEVYDQYFEKLGINDARELVRLAYGRPSKDEKLCLVVRANFINLEAQNALLKILEEPPESSQFIFVLPNDFTVLPTLASRFNQVHNLRNDTNGQTAEFDTFLVSGYKDRLAAIDLSVKNKDSVWQRAIKSGLIAYLKSDGRRQINYKELEFVARTLLTRGASNKMLLEHMSLLLASREQFE